MSDTQQPFQPAPEWVSHLQHTVNTIAKQQEALMQLMRGNPINPDDKGSLGDISTLKTRYHALEARVNSLEKERDRAVAWMAGAVCVGGLAVTIVYSLLKLIK